MAASANNGPTLGDASQPLVSLRHVTLRYSDGPQVVTALDDVSLDLAQGERVCILGANGSGKSTLASVICGLLAPDEGSVSLVGEQVLGPEGVDFAAYRRARQQIGLVFQNPDDQMVTSIVEEDVAFGPENLCLAPEEIDRRVARELERVAMTSYARSNPAKLSGGQKQRVAIAGALAMEPRVLVLDEPGALLDVRGRRGIMRVMGELDSLGTTVVHITHFMDEALAADRVIVLGQGHLLFDGSPDEVFSHGEELAALGLELPFTAQLSSALRARGLDLPWTCEEETLRTALHGMMRTRPAQGPARPAADASGAAARASHIVQVEDVSYSYHDEENRWALRQLSLELTEGSSVAVVGQTGSGKSTLVRLLCALELPDQGRIVIDGIDTTRKKDRRRLHGRVGYVMQHPERQLFAETVLDDVAYGPRNLGLSPQEVERRCAWALQLVGLTGKEQASPFQLSGGQQRLCALAGIIAMEPDILVLDEPTAGLDPRGRKLLEGILDDIHARGVTIIRVTHSMESAALAEQLVVLCQSRLLIQGSPREVFCADNEQTLHDAGLGLPEPLRWALSLGLTTAPLSLEQLVDDLLASIAPPASGEVS